MSNGAVTAVDVGPDECLKRLATHTVGRLCLVENGYPVAYPVNYRLVFQPDRCPAIVMCVRAGGALDHPGVNVGFEIDGMDHVDETGWSVLARGVLRDGRLAGAPEWLKYWNPQPWTGPRDQWLYLPVEAVTGRQLLASTTSWAVRVTGYL
jgi:Pyridoxamine 5'-phosphate oxidase